MANPRHLELLNSGVEKWNRWRLENPEVVPDLSKADLTGMDLSRLNLDSAEVHNAQLRDTRLGGAFLQNADFSHSFLRGAYLIDVYARFVDFSCANLGNADLSGAYLVGARLDNAILWTANFINANLSETNLENSDLRSSILIQSDLRRAKLTGAKLYGAARDDWIIKDVKCKYVYWDALGRQRSPKDRDLQPGEYERLYAALPTIEYIFEEGMSPIDPLIMDQVVQTIREKRPEFDIRIDSINARGLAPSIKFAVQHKDHKKPALAEVSKGYEKRIERLEADKERLYELFAQAIENIRFKDQLLARRDKLLAEAVGKIGDTISTGPDSVVVSRSYNVNIQQYVSYARELQKAIAEEPKDSERFANVAKKTALDIIGGAIKDIAKGQVKEAAKRIIELGKELGSIIVETAAYAFFSNIGS